MKTIVIWMMFDFVGVFKKKIMLQFPGLLPGVLPGIVPGAVPGVIPATGFFSKNTPPVLSHSLVVRVDKELQ